jgi:uncharacterized protein (TIRG00374 family)
MEDFPSAPEPALDPSEVRRSPVGRFLRAATSVAIGVGLLVGVLPRLADLGEVWDSVGTLTTSQIVLLLTLSAWNILTYQFVMVAALPGLRLSHAFLTGQISTAVTNTVPAGSLVGIGVTYAILSSFGHQGSAIALAAVLTGWWNTLVKFGLPVVALLVLSLQGDVNEGMLSAAAAGLALLVGAVIVLVAVTTSERLARSAGRLLARIVSGIRRVFGRGPVVGWVDRFARFQERSAALLKRRWHWLSLATLISHLSLFALLLLSLRAMGVTVDQVTGAEALGAFAIVRLATALPITPGGIGVVEVGMAAALVVAGGEEAAVVAAVLVYRALTYLLQVALGVVSYGLWRRATRVAPPP